MRAILLLTPVLLVACQASTAPEPERAEDVTGVDPYMEQRIRDLIYKLQGNYPLQQRRAKTDLVLIGGPAVPYLVANLRNERPGIRAYSAEALGEIGEGEAAIPVARLTDDPERKVQLSALRALGNIGDPRGGEAALRMIRSHDRTVRMVAADAVRKMHYADAIPDLLDLLDSPDWRNRAYAQQGLSRITFQNFRADSHAWRGWWNEKVAEANQAGLEYPDVFHAVEHLHATPAQIERARIAAQERQRKTRATTSGEAYHRFPDAVKQSRERPYKDVKITPEEAAKAHEFMNTQRKRNEGTLNDEPDPRN